MYPYLTYSTLGACVCAEPEAGSSIQQGMVHANTKDQDIIQLRIRMARSFLHVYVSVITLAATMYMYIPVLNVLYTF